MIRLHYFLSPELGLLIFTVIRKINQEKVIFLGTIKALSHLK